MTDPTVAAGVRAALGPVGVWFAQQAGTSMNDERRAAQRIEALGYGSLWTGEGLRGKEAFARHGALLGATDRLVTGTAIANVWAREPATMQSGGATLVDAFPGRFVLGLGVSHSSIVTPGGHHYQRPLARMRAYLDAMDEVAATDSRSVPRVLAALGPRMLELAAERTDGAAPYFVPPEHTEIARAILGDEGLLIPEQAITLEQDPATARAVARVYMAPYLRMPNYVDNLRRLGFTDDDVLGTGSERLVDAIVAHGGPDAVARRVRDHLDAGADHVLVQALAVDLAQALRRLEELAPHVVASG